MRRPYSILYSCGLTVKNSFDTVREEGREQGREEGIQIGEEKGKKEDIRANNCLEQKQTTLQRVTNITFSLFSHFFQVY